MSERDYTVETSDHVSAYREEWINRGAGVLIERGTITPTITVNVIHGDQWVRESMDLTEVIDQWVKDIKKDLKKR